MKNVNSLFYEEVAQRAREIWSSRGGPGGCDLEIWVEAERQLAISSPGSSATDQASSRTGSDAKGATAFTARVKAETAAESVVEYFISPPASEEEAVEAALQSSNFLATSFNAEHSRWRGLW